MYKSMKPLFEVISALSAMATLLTIATSIYEWLNM
jgi:hypothetical protein